MRTKLRITIRCGLKNNHARELHKSIFIRNFAINDSPFPKDRFVELYTGQESTVSGNTIQFPSYQNRLPIFAKQ